jgi:hypothetical protein
MEFIQWNSMEWNGMEFLIGDACLFGGSHSLVFSRLQFITESISWGKQNRIDEFNLAEDGFGSYRLLGNSKLRY